MQTQIILEVPVDSATGALAGEAAGASRLELCAALPLGGVTPSAALIETVAERLTHADAYVLIRPRPGDFVYDAEEVSVMVDDIEYALQHGASGVSIGALRPDGSVDRDVCRRLVDAAGGRPVTFHRAFDQTRDPLAALEDIIDLGFARLLTSGQAQEVGGGIPLLRALVRTAGDRLVVMPGGGVTELNVRPVLFGSGATEIHASGKATIDGPVTWRESLVHFNEIESGTEWERTVTDLDRLRRLLAVANDPGEEA